MKKSFALMFAFLLLFSCIACQPATATPAPQVSPAAEETVAPSATPTPEPTATPIPTPTPTPKPGQAEYESGLQLLQAGNAPSAIELMSTAFELGYAKAAEQIGSMYHEGFFIVPDDYSAFVRDYPASKQWYEKAIALWKEQADAGDSDALYNLGRMYAYGYGVPRDQAKADEYFSLAASQGHAGAKKRVVRYSPPTGEALKQETDQISLGKHYSDMPMASLSFLVLRVQGALKVVMVSTSAGDPNTGLAYFGFQELFSDARMVDVPDYKLDYTGPGFELWRYPLVILDTYKDFEPLLVVPASKINELYDYLDIDVPAGETYDTLFGKEGRFGIHSHEENLYEKFLNQSYSYESYRSFFIDLIPAEYRLNLTQWFSQQNQGKTATFPAVPQAAIAALGVVTPETIYDSNSEAFLCKTAAGQQKIFYTYSKSQDGKLQIYDRFTETLLFVCNENYDYYKGVDVSSIEPAIPYLVGMQMIEYTDVVMITNYGSDWGLVEMIYPIQADGSIINDLTYFSNDNWAKIYLLLTPKEMQVTAAEILQ